MDAEGNKIWEKSFVGEPWGKFPAVVGLNNGNFAMSYKRYDWSNTQIQAPPCVQGISPDKDSLWEHCFLNFLHVNIVSMRKAKNGDIIGCGAKAHGEPGQSGWLFRMTQEGEVLWERNIFYDLDPYTGHWGGDFWGITEDDEGNIWVAGSCSDTFPNHNPMRNSNNAWVLKLSAGGCLLSGCTDDVQLVSDIINSTEKKNDDKVENNEVIISPNPTSDQINITLSNDLLIRGYSIYNMTGELLTHKTIVGTEELVISLDAYQKGVFKIKVIAENGISFLSSIVKY